MEDKELAEKLLAGDRRVFCGFYKKYSPKLSGYVSTRVGVGQDCEEIVQDSFLAFLDSLPMFSGRSSLWTFLVGIAKHEIADYYRKMYAKKAIRHVPFVNQVYTQPLYDASETRKFFDLALSAIKPRHKELILLKYEERLSIKDIAEKLGLAEKVVESRLWRARGAFKLAYATLESSKGK